MRQFARSGSPSAQVRGLPSRFCRRVSARNIGCGSLSADAWGQLDPPPLADREAEAFALADYAVALDRSGNPEAAEHWRECVADSVTLWAEP
jgi:hypothetical protein